MKTLPRAATAVLAFALALVFVPLSVDWNSIRWGTAPEWIGAVALLSIAAGVWRLAYTSGLREHSARDRNAGIRSR